MTRLSPKISYSVVAASLLFSCAALLLGGRIASAQEAFLRGDVNADGRVSTSDALMGRRYLFLGGPLDCPNALDVDDNGRVNITDVVKGILGFLFGPGEPPAPPYPQVAVDQTPNEQHIVCRSYDVVVPEQTEDVVSLQSTAAAPGEEVEVPVFVNSSKAVEAFQLVVAYDPSLFTPLPLDGEGALSFDGTYYQDADLRLYYAIVKVDEQAGVFLVSFIPDLILNALELPAGTVEPAFKIRGEIPADAPPGAVAELTPTNGTNGEGYGPAHLKNELTHQGDARLVSTEPRLEGALVQIVGDVTLFIRGDSNGDENVDLSDAVMTLDYLFKSGETPPCLDAADANDDGSLNISDAVATVLHLFVHGGDLPPPFSEAGTDPTSDQLDCDIGP